MRTQKPISLRINEGTLKKLDEYIDKSKYERPGMNRNAIINLAIERYITLDKLNDLYRLGRLIGNEDKVTFCDENLRFFRSELPEFLRWPLRKR